MFQQSPDEWETHLHYIEALKYAEKRNIEDERSFYLNLQRKAITEKNIMRGPFLGEMYWSKAFGKGILFI